jgi:hypothetical protein
LSCFFDVAKVLRKTRQKNRFPTTPPKNPRFWEKSGISWENKKPTRSAGKNKKKSYNINKKTRKYPHFPASLFLTLFPINCCIWENRGFLGKNRGIIGKNPMFLGKMVI